VGRIKKRKEERKGRPLYRTTGHHCLSTLVERKRDTHHHESILSRILEVLSLTHIMPGELSAYLSYIPTLTMSKPIRRPTRAKYNSLVRK